MARYLIIDTRFINEDHESFELLKKTGFILSHEETEAKWKHCFDMGYYSHEIDPDGGYKRQEWSDYKETL